MVSIDDQELSVLYPAFVRTDVEDRIQAFGPAIARHAPDAAVGAPCSSVFEVGSALPDQGLTSPEGPMAFLRLVARGSGVAFNGSRLPQEDGSVYLLTPCSSSVEAFGADRFELGDFPPGDSRIANLVTLSLQRSLLAEAQHVVDQLSKARDAAVVALRAQTVFLSGVSHELRTPLTSICGYAELLTDIAGPEIARPARRLREAAQSLESKLDNLLDYAALRGGQMSVVRVETRRGVLLEFLEPFAQNARAKGLDFRVREGGGVPEMLDVPRLVVGQVLQNLIQNAIAFTAYGFVEVEVSYTERQRLRFVVRDTGPGLPPERAERLFESFGGVGYRTAEQAQGLGLGLAMCWELVNLAGGDIGLLETGPSGTAFYFEIPAAN